MHVTSLLLYNVQFHCTPPPPPKSQAFRGLDFANLNVLLFD